MPQIAERVCTLRSLVDRGCEIVMRLEKISVTNSRGVWNSRKSWKKGKILKAKGRVGF